MPDDITTLLGKCDVIETKIEVIEGKLELVLQMLKGKIAPSDIIDVESPYYNPDTKMYDFKYYKENRDKEKKPGGITHAD